MNFGVLDPSSHWAELNNIHVASLSWSAVYVYYFGKQDFSIKNIFISLFKMSEYQTGSEKNTDTFQTIDWHSWTIKMGIPQEKEERQ